MSRSRSCAGRVAVCLGGLVALAGSAASVVSAASAAPVPAQGAKRERPAEPVIDENGVPVRDLLAGGDAKKRFFLIGPRDGVRPEKEGYGCLIVMPGGTGSADFHPFVKNIWLSSCPRDFVVVQLVAPKWVEQPKVIWPMDPGDQPGMEFTTREQLDATVADVVKVQKVKLDPRRTYQLAWSSSGPPAYRMALDEKPPVAGSYIAMSVFHEGELRLSRAKGRIFFLDHSPDDERCKFADSQRAKEKLSAEGAAVELVTFPGGHGWFDQPMARLEKGILWLEEQREARDKARR